MFRDRRQAGEVLAGMLASFSESGAQVLAIPAGGVPVALAVAPALGLALDVAPVSKITLPWNTEAGYGAVAFDGTVRLNRALTEQLGLSDTTVGQGVARTTAKVRRRAERLRPGRPPLELAGRAAIVVDDGLASGFTMQVAVEALRGLGAEQIVVAVPTGHVDALERVSQAADELYCANVRDGRRFAVADAYRQWDDVDENGAARLLGVE